MKEKTMEALLEALSVSAKETGQTSMITRGIRQILGIHYGKPGLIAASQRLQTSAATAAEGHVNPVLVETAQKKSSIDAPQQLPAPDEQVKKKQVKEKDAAAGNLADLPFETNAMQVDFEAMATDISEATIPGAANKYSKAELVSLVVVREIPISEDPQEMSSRQLVKIIKEHLKGKK